MSNHSREAITATELVRNLSAVVDQVRISRRSVYITKGSLTVAELRPPPKAGYPISRLAEFLKSLPGLSDDASAFEEDLVTIKREARLPENPWD